MNRLTKRTTCGTANLAYPESCYFKSGAKDQITVSAYRQQAIERLAEYEDTGLEPETIVFLKNVVNEEYIRREAAIKAIENDCLELVYYTKEDAIQCAKVTPAADVVEVVRCRECKYSYKDEIFGNRWCDSHLGCRKVKDDGYCYLGERKEGTDND